MPAIFQLAQTNTGKPSPTPKIVWAAIAGIAILMVGGAILIAVRKRLLDRQTPSDVSGSLMEQLREAHRRGELSDAEYEQARKSMASRVSQVLDTKRAGGLFELPDPKRRVGRPATGIGPMAPPPSPSGAPPGYQDPGESANNEARP